MSRPPEQIHLLIDGRCLRARATGTGTALWRLLLGLEEVIAPAGEDRWRVTVLRLRPECRHAAFQRRWKVLPNIHALDVDVYPERHPRADAWLLAGLPRLARRLGADVLYSPAFLSPPWTPGLRRLVMVHDDLPWTQPRSYPARFRTYLAAATRLSTRFADRVLFPSRDAAHRAGDILDLPAGRRFVLPHAVDPALHRPGPPVGERPPLLLCIASAEARKNQELLLRALREPVTSPGRPRPELVLAGFRDPGGKRLAALRRIPCAVDWRIAEAPSDRELAGLLRRASALLLPTRGEGFGLPVLEAMACGTPLVLSDLPVLREVAGEAASYAAPDDVAEWRRLISYTLAGGEPVAERVRTGLARAEKATPERLARRFLRLAGS